MKLSVDLEIVFGSNCYYDTQSCLELIKSYGIDIFEVWNHRMFDVEKLALAAKNCGMTLSCCSANRDYNVLELPDHSEAFFSQLAENIAAAKRLGSCNLSLLSECLNETDLSVVPTKKPMSYDAKLIALYKGLSECAGFAEKNGVYLNLETLNSLVDHSGYFCVDMDRSMEIIKAIGNPHLRSLFDLYHLQIMEGNIINQIEKYFDWIGVVHVADVPGRHEPGSGEINYSNIAKCLKHNGYQGFVVLESSPSDGDPRTAIEGFLEAFG